MRLHETGQFSGAGKGADAGVEVGVTSATPCTGPGRPFVEFGTWSATIL